MQKLEGCLSCGIKFVKKGFVRFPCPVCGTLLGRCARCRKQSVEYRCPNCDFIGP